MSRRFSFGEFVLDSDTRELRRGRHAVLISPKAFQLLEILIENQPKAMAKGTLQDLLWPNTFVVEKNVANLVAEIREALGDPAQQPRFVRTVPRFGYAFLIAPAATTDDAADAWAEGDSSVPSHVGGGTRGAVRRGPRSRARPRCRALPRLAERVATPCVDQSVWLRRDARGSWQQERYVRRQSSGRGAHATGRWRRDQSRRDHADVQGHSRAWSHRYLVTSCQSAGIELRQRRLVTRGRREPN